MARTPWLPRRQPATVTASAQPMAGQVAGQQDKPKPVEPWQTQAQRYASSIPLVAFTAQMLSGLLSGCEWYVAGPDGQRNDQLTARVEEHCDDQNGAASSDSGLARIAGRTGHHYLVSGECWLVWLETKRWEIVGSPAITFRGDTIEVKLRAAGRPVTLERKRAVRVWVPDWDYPQDAWSPMRAILDECARYELLNENVQRVASSRLVQNGVFWSPSEAHEMVASDNGAGDTSALLRDYYNVASKSLHNVSPKYVGAAAPFPMFWPHEYGPPQYVPFGSPLESEAVALREEARRSIAEGLPFPNLMLLEGPGSGGNHWGDLVADEQLFRQGVEPFAERIAADLTVGLLAPMLRVYGGQEGSRIVFDPANILRPPDKRADAIRLFELGLVDEQFVLEAHGIDRAQLQRDAPIPMRQIESGTIDDGRDMPNPPARFASLHPFMVR